MKADGESRKKTDLIVDGTAAAGLCMLGAGTWARFGWPAAAIVVGALLIGLAVVAAARGAGNA